MHYPVYKGLRTIGVLSMLYVLRNLWQNQFVHNAVNTKVFIVGICQVNQIEYDLLSTPTGVCITCTFLDSSITDCVAVVHQRISQLGSIGLMNIESSHKFNRSGDTAYGCIEVVNLTAYQIGVVDLYRSVNKPITSRKLS